MPCACGSVGWAPQGGGHPPAGHQAQGHISGGMSGGGHGGPGYATTTAGGRNGGVPQPHFGGRAACQRGRRPLLRSNGATSAAWLLQPARRRRCARGAQPVLKVWPSGPWVCAVPTAPPRVPRACTRVRDWIDRLRPDDVPVRGRRTRRYINCRCQRNWAAIIVRGLNGATGFSSSCGVARFGGCGWGRGRACARRFSYPID